MVAESMKNMEGNGLVVECAVGVDIGGTKINAGLIDRQGRILLQQTVPTLAAERKVMEQAAVAVEALLSQAASRFPELKPAGIGIGSAGQIDFRSGRVHFASDLIPGYTGTPVREIVEARFGLPVYVDNDVNVLALAEKYFGAGRDADHMLCLALGTGVGGAVVTEGRLVHGAFGGAGEIGHVSVDFRGPRCRCGNFGCLELYASGTGIAGMYNERAESAADAKQVVERWLQGEPLAGRVMDDVIAALATAVASLIHTLNPQRVVIGGGVAEVGEPLFAPLREQVARRTMPSMLAEVRIEQACMGNKSGMVGAAMQIWEYGQA